MQLTARSASIPESSWDEPAPQADNTQSEMMREYVSRRCHICQGRDPPFGFAPSLARHGRRVWACSAHRAEVDRVLGRGPVIPAEKKQPTLL